MQISKILPMVQIAISAVLIAVILLQQKGGGLSAVFGGSETSYHTKRGFEKKLFIITIVLAALFAVLSVTILLVK
jgi:protein translocase SecG subunit